MQKPPVDYGLYLVTDRSFFKNDDTQNSQFLACVEQAIAGGVSVVQLREKQMDTLRFYTLALAVKSLLASHKIPLIINDRLDIALAVDADGLHIGQQDLPYMMARKLLGKSKLIGLSVENTSQAIKANEFDLDYIGISPVFDTNTKADTAPPLELEGIKAIKKISNHPLVAIGGISHHNAHSVLESGADGLAVVSAIMGARDPQLSAANFRQLL